MLAKSLADLFADRPDGFLLVIAIRNFVIYGDTHQIQPLCPPIHELLQILFAENPADFALRAGLIVPEIGLKSVGGEHHGTAVESSFQTVCVQKRLSAPGIGIPAGSFGLYQCKGKAILAKKHIVHESCLSHDSRHSIHGIFLLHVGIGSGELPSHFLHIHVNVCFAGFELRKILRLKGTLLLMLLFLRCILRGHLFNLSAQSFDLRLLLPQKALLFPDLPCIHDNLFRRDQRLVKNTLPIIRTIAIINPLNKLEQCTQRCQGISRLYASPGMHCQITQLNDKGELSPGIVIHRKAKVRLVNQRLQIIPVWHFHGIVRRIYPLNGQLQCLPAAHGAHGRNGRIDFFRLQAGRRKEGVFRCRFQKFEV